MKTKSIVIGSAVALVAGGLSGTALAAVSNDAGGSRADRVGIQPFAYPTNSAGETYGSLADAPSEEMKPDLILVQLADGSTGYVRSEAYDAWLGNDPASPAEAAQSMTGVSKRSTSGLEVVAKDGDKVIGSWSPDGS